MTSDTPPSDPATDPEETKRIEALLVLHRSGVPSMILRAQQTLARCKAALELSQQSPADAEPVLRANQAGLDGLRRHFQIGPHNLEALDTVVGNYQKLFAKVSRLPFDQAAIDYPTFTREFPKLAFNKDGLPLKTPAFTDLERAKMFFTPIYRPTEPFAPDLFMGFPPGALQSMQLHQMCRFYLSMDDSEPAGAPTASCLRLARAYTRFAIQLTVGRTYE
jgi:hypothetical protein